MSEPNDAVDPPARPGGAGLKSFIDQRVATIRAKSGDAVSLREVGVVVGDILGSMSGQLDAGDVQLYQEIQELARYIQQARGEIAALNPVDIREDFLPTATDELDAIVQSTETATGAIMDCAEIVETVAGAVAPDQAERLMNAVTQIYEACSFQDITGQRITKVVRMMKSIEQRVEGLIRAFGSEALAAQGGEMAPTSQSAVNLGRQTAAAHGDEEGDMALLNGPQDDDDAMSQNTIDSLLDGFDDKN